MAFVATDAFKNVGLNAMAGDGLYLSLHSAAPSTTGLNEISGGSPAYARKAASWASASAGAVAISGSLAFDVPASTVAYVGVWTAVSGGTFRGYWPVTAAVFSGQGTYTLTAATLSLTTV